LLVVTIRERARKAPSGKEKTKSCSRGRIKTPSSKLREKAVDARGRARETSDESQGKTAELVSRGRPTASQVESQADQVEPRDPPGGVKSPTN